MTVGIVLAALLTHSILFGGKDLATEYPAWTYSGMSQRALLAVDAVWYHAHGLPSEGDCRAALDRAHAAAHSRMVDVRFSSGAAGVVCDASHSHIGDFLRFFIPAVELVCPTLGFLCFLLLAGLQPGLRLWRPLAIVTVALVFPHSTFWGEIARAAIVALAMAASVALLSDTKRRENAI